MRYERQILVKQIGQQGQEKIIHSKVVVIGAGGLASPVLTYLVCAGVGDITIIDYDTVSITNLNRQFLYGEMDINESKSYRAKEVLNRMNSEVIIHSIRERVCQDNIMRLIEGADVVIDCVDNIETRLIVNRGCLMMGIPLVEGGINGLYGFVMVVRREGPCLECMGYHNTKLKPPVPVLGAIVGVIGSLQAVECIKILLGLEEVLYGKMLNYDGLTGSFETIDLVRNEDCEAHRLL
ncbi:MAG TPA: HesA/MoeB/ThiF family protein [Lachnospiraceae bacterium]|nr:HesA/MoeB/ThiF family protein [Lachnospiraceae bacterium]